MKTEGMRCKVCVATMLTVLLLPGLVGFGTPAMGQACDYDWTGTEYENDCPPCWNGAGDGCDCGCQFIDTDCGVIPPGSCDYDWTGSEYENNCPSSWNGAGDGCDCGCQFQDSDCGTVGCQPGEVEDCNGNCASEAWIGDGICDDGSRSWNGVSVRFDCSQFSDDGGDCYTPPPPGCDYDWTGTEYQNNCPGNWNGAGDGCDCGCQFTDADCSDVIDPPCPSVCGVSLPCGMLATAAGICRMRRRRNGGQG